MKPRRVKVQILRDPAGNVLCSCGCGHLVKPPRRNWHSSACVEAWRQTNDPGYIRAKLFKRDKGICAICRCDANAELRRAREADRELNRMLGWLTFWHRTHTAQWDRGRQIWWVPQGQPTDYKAIKAWTKKARQRWTSHPGWTLDRKTGWDADHIIPVAEGGGQCRWEDYRTLCHPCHKKQTAELARRRAERRRQEAMDS